MMKPAMSTTSTFSLVASSDEAYGSDKSVSGFDETLRRGRSKTESVKHRYQAILDFSIPSPCPSVLNTFFASGVEALMCALANS